MSVTTKQAAAALQQTSILKEQWDHAKEARVILRVPLWINNPLSLEIVNVGEPTIVVRRILVNVPVTTHSSSTINIDVAPTLILPKNAVHQVDVDSAIRDFIRLRHIPGQTFQSLAEIVVLGESWDKPITEGMWVLVQMRDGRIRTSVGTVNLTTGCDLEAFDLYKQRHAGDMKMPVPMPLFPDIR